MKANNKVQIKAKNRPLLRTRLIYVYSISSLVVLIIVALSIVFNIGLNSKSSAKTKINKFNITSTSIGDWEDAKIWETLSGNTIPEGNMEIGIHHLVNSSKQLELSGTLFISKSGKLVIDELKIQNGGVLHVEGELYVNRIVFEKGSFVNISKEAILVVNEDLTNMKKSDNIYIDGNVQIFGNCYNGSNSEIYGEGKIAVNGDFKGGGLEFSISPLVEVTGEIEQTEKDPINLLYFQAHIEENSTILKWTTEFESNNNYFTVERSSNGLDFEEIGQIFGSGFSSNAVNYTFEDTKPVPNKTLFYRLKYTSFEGVSSDLNIIVAETSQTNRL